MAYATSQNIEDRYGSIELLLVCDRDGDGSADTGVADNALDDATDEIDIYIGAKYDLPLATTPSILTRLCVDIAMYRLASNAGAASEQKRERYEDAVRTLKAIAAGQASLGIDAPPESISHDVRVVAATRQFTRSKLDGIL